eukprot:CAMPEP_0113487422 /NCGR_PEP_ID=MMETSP0014_2-20120614/25501_1 /TAXON_ID=2857 /ORGANISM="Nitzschia sp." /LENGTH=1227 /DNA_ID=CAMNT_0000381119 /DNA_START=95 /DNA_END=3778 /DNA_ORIENTATION=- /assembly_acc=CAM_ASM_000159
MSSSSSSSSNAPTNNVVNFVWSYAPLLSGGVYDCQNIDDESCEGGIAVLLAHLRNHSSPETDQGNCIIPRIDYQSAFVQMHPLEWGVNRVVLGDYFGYKSYFIYRSFMTQHKTDTVNSVRDLSSLHTRDIRPLVGNFVVYTENSWFEYIQNIHFDPNTGLAVFPIDEGKGSLDLSLARGVVQRVDQVASAKGLLTFIDQINRSNGCKGSAVKSPYDMYMESRNLTSSMSMSMPMSSSQPTSEFTDVSQLPNICWLPVIVYEEWHRPSWDYFLEEITTKFDLPPAVIVDVRENDSTYNEEPQMVGRNNSTTWVVSYTNHARDFFQNKIILSPDKRSVVGVELIHESMKGPPPSSIKDEQLEQDLKFVRSLADDAVLNDPVKGQTGYFPEVRNTMTSARRCLGGECELGNLFTDAMRWKTGADIAFIASGGIRGPGWPEGDVRVSNIWEALPFANTLCEGVLSGVSLYRIFEHSTRIATFQAHWTREGDRLLQVSGMRYSYNTNIMNTTRLVSIDVWDEEQQDYQPVERLKLYKFATSSWMCYGFDPFPSFLGPEYMTITGEEPGTISDELMQNTVGDYLQSLNGEMYPSIIEGRLRNETDVFEVLDMIQTEETCPGDTYWVEEYSTCFDCPSTDNVAFTNETIADFNGYGGSSELYYGNAKVVNNEDFPVTLFLKLKPNWVTITSPEDVVQSRTTLDAGESMDLEFIASAAILGPGTAQSAVSFGVVDGGSYPGCEGRDASFEVFMNVEPPPELLKPGNIRFAGLAMMGIVLLTAFGFAMWVKRNLRDSMIQKLQPRFLLLICTGAAVIALSILPISIKDEIPSDSGRDMACMSVPWLIIVGFTIVMSALFAKLWRINKIFNRRFRRVKVTEESASYIVAAFFITNLVLLSAWNGVAPFTYETFNVPDSTDNQQYATCALAENKAAGWTFLSLIIFVNFVSLVLACHEAFKARNISEKYSEAKGLGRALFSWVQISIVGVPVILLLKGDNPSAKYFVEVMLVFAICLTLLCFIFVPIVVALRQERLNPSSRKKSIRVSGMNFSDIQRMQSSDLRNLSATGSRPIGSVENASDLTGNGSGTSNTKSHGAQSRAFGGTASDQFSSNRSPTPSIPSKMVPISDSTPSSDQEMIMVSVASTTDDDPAVAAAAAEYSATTFQMVDNVVDAVDPEQPGQHTNTDGGGGVETSPTATLVSSGSSNMNTNDTASTSHLSSVHENESDKTDGSISSS